MAESQPRYDVQWDVATPDIRAVWRRVKSLPISERQRLHAALRQLEQELSNQPLNWGEPKYELKQIALLICIGFSHHYRVEYGVDQKRRVVLIRDFRDADD